MINTINTNTKSYLKGRLLDWLVGWLQQRQQMCQVFHKVSQSHFNVFKPHQDEPAAIAGRYFILFVKRSEVRV